jgi:hypothetical protein
MIPIPSDTHPPRWLQAVVSALLPPAYRDIVLGDLHERFRNRGRHARRLRYMGDVVTTVPQILRIQIRRSLMRGPRHGDADLRSRAERFQTEVWNRNTIGLAACVLVVGAFLANARGAWHFQEFVSLAMTFGWVGAFWQSYGVRGRSTTVPASLSGDALRAFHRRELTRQRDLGFREFVYWFVPAILLVLYGLTGAIPGFRGGASLLGVIAMQIVLMAAVHEKERRRLQRELDREALEVEGRG